MSANPAWEALVNRYLDGEASAEEVARLNEVLRGDVEARRAYAELANLDSALAESAAGWMEVAVVAPTPARKVRPFAQTPWLAAAACLTICLLGAWWWQASTRNLATVVSVVGIREFSAGAVLRSERYEIAAGTVEFVTARGARVVIEAPAAFQFESAQKLHLLHGRVAADVPPLAKGFTVITPTGKAVDLGTKFGVDVPLEGEAEIHVFQGEVIAQSSGGGKKQSLRDGEAYSLQSGAGTSRELRSSAFIRPDEIAALQAGFAAGQRSQADAALAALRKDPALIELLDFEGASLPEGTYRMVQGRWPGSRAPEFIHVGDHMKLAVGGEHGWQQLTMAAWVRLDRLGEPYQSLYHTDGWQEDKPGQVHWIINRDTTMRLALKHNTLAAGSDEKFGYPDSRTPVLPERGRWVHLAVVYDAEKRTVRFYLNGAFDKETHQEKAFPARLGPARIGNWDEKDRMLSGRVDELVLLGRAMSDAEISKLYDAGNPYR